jgi:hypothetical protein
MREIKGNLWDFEAEAVVITTNGTVKNNGECVMGRGCAREAADKFPGLAKELGELIEEFGNRVFALGGHGERYLYTFPVKNNWWEIANLDLIERSTKQLFDLVDKTYKDNTIVLPRPGCGNGKLEWKEVKPILERYLDDRFYVITF